VSDPFRASEAAIRIPFPVRIPLAHSCTFAVVLCVVQLLEGTPAYFSLYSFFFIMIATLAFNTAGGLSRPSGGYVFFYAWLAVIVGLVFKAFLGEPADSNLLAPHTTMLAYVVTITGMCGAAYLKKILLPARSVLDRIGKGTQDSMGAAGVGCIVVGLAMYVWGVFVAGANVSQDAAANNGTLYGALRQLDRFLPLGIILGVTYTIRKTRGRRLISLPVLFATIFVALFLGLFNFSKEGMFSPFLCIVLAAAALRFQFSVMQVVVSLLAIVLSVQYLVPVIQRGKALTSGNLSENIDTTINLLTDAGELHEESVTAQDIQYADEDDFTVHYYNSSHGLFDRLQMISVDDALIDTTEQGQVFGLLPIFYDVANIVPHFIWPGKPSINIGNVYLHEISQAHYRTAGEEDTTTGISFSPTADAFHEAKWIGVGLIAPALFFMCFFVMDWVCGDARTSPFGLLAVVACGHMAPEGMLFGPFYLSTLAMASILTVAFMSVYVLPILGSLVIGPGRRQPPPIRRRVAFPPPEPASLEAES
jgi:hypothetical protein